MLLRCDCLDLDFWLCGPVRKLGAKSGLIPGSLLCRRILGIYCRDSARNSLISTGRFCERRRIDELGWPLLRAIAFFLASDEMRPLLIHIHSHLFLCRCYIKPSKRRRSSPSQCSSGSYCASAWRRAGISQLADR
jgi:hypothetical protein